MCGQQQGFLRRHLDERPNLPQGPPCASVPVRPEPPRPGARSCSLDLWRTRRSEPAQPGKGLRFPPIGIHITAHGGPQLWEELDTAWVSKVGGGGRPEAETAAMSPPPHPDISRPPSGSPPPSASRLCALSPLSGPAACSQPVHRADPRAPGPCARRRRRRRRRPGTMRANVFGRASPLCKCPTACENPPPPPPRLPPPERGWRPGLGRRSLHRDELSSGSARPGQSAIVYVPPSDRQWSSPAWGGRQKVTQTRPWDVEGMVTCSVHICSYPQRALTLGSDRGGTPISATPLASLATCTSQFISLSLCLLEVKPGR
nr:WAS/WASL-interacting protein family member 2-like [Equus asinus]XP_044613905.1 WAS/WASL-interacting protein family member 2-like [Equus asinus]